MWTIYWLYSAYHVESHGHISLWCTPSASRILETKIASLKRGSRHQKAENGLMGGDGHTKGCSSSCRARCSTNSRSLWWCWGPAQSCTRIAAHSSAWHEREQQVWNAHVVGLQFSVLREGSSTIYFGMVEADRQNTHSTMLVTKHRQLYVHCELPSVSRTVWHRCLWAQHLETCKLVFAHVCSDGLHKSCLGVLPRWGVAFVEKWGVWWGGGGGWGGGVRKSLFADTGLRRQTCVNGDKKQISGYLKGGGTQNAD